MAVLFWCIYLLRLGVSHPRVEPLIAFSHILELNSGSQDCKTSHCEVLLPESPHDSFRVPCGISVQWFVSKRLFSYPVVEFAIAEMACVSRNIRTAVPAVYGIPVQRSISGRDVSHPKMVFYFCFRILIGCLGILGLLRRRMVVVSHLFRPQRC